MFKIVTDSTADLPVEYLKEHDLGCMNLSYIMDGVTYGQGQELPEKEFYALMRQGKMPTTSQVNPEEAKAHFTEYLKENKEILCIAFSSGLSGTYNSMRIAADEIMEEQPDCKIIVIDSLCASLGEGLLVHKAVTLRDQGKSMEEVAEWVKNNRLHLVHVFTVDDLYHLYRGGRVSKATAFVGTLAGIKPKPRFPEANEGTSYPDETVWSAHPPAVPPELPYHPEASPSTHLTVWFYRKNFLRRSGSIPVGTSAPAVLPYSCPASLSPPVLSSWENSSAPSGYTS